jgi:hypothetical protein
VNPETFLASYAFIESARSIGTIVPQVAIREISRDEAMLTMHPLITGTPSTDHMFLLPQLVELFWGWSDSNAQEDGFVIELYQMLLALQQSRQIFSVTTGKRQYPSMQALSIQVTTDETSEYTLPVIAICRQMIITSQMTTTTPNTDGNQQIGGPQPPPTGTGATYDPSSGTYMWNGVPGVPGGYQTVGFGGASLFPIPQADNGASSLVPSTVGPSFGQSQSNLFQ